MILVGLESGKLGFPCEITDDPLLNLVMAEPDTYPHSEERRLFYVAVTRAKKHVYLLYNPNKTSTFIKEITRENYPITTADNEFKAIGNCLRCNGELVLRNGTHSDFYGCINYPYCEYTAPRCPECKTGSMTIQGRYYVCKECGHVTRRCPDCGEGFEVLRRGPYSQFWGCSNYPECKHTRNN